MTEEQRAALAALDPAWIAREQRIWELEQKRRIAFEKDREKARQEEAARKALELEIWEKFQAEREQRLAQAKAQEEIKARELWEANNRAQKERERRQVEEWQARRLKEDEESKIRAERLREEGRRKEAQAKAREEGRKRAAEERERLRIRCRAFGKRGFTKHFKRQQHRFRWLAQIAAAKHWRATCKAAYEKRSPDARRTLDDLEAQRRWESLRRCLVEEDPVEDNQDYDDVGRGYRSCPVSSGRWDNAVRAIEDGYLY